MCYIRKVHIYPKQEKKKHVSHGQRFISGEGTRTGAHKRSAGATEERGAGHVHEREVPSHHRL